MNLHETVEALRAKEIEVAFDIGVHQYCGIDSNCPLAIQLRRLIADAGVTLEQLLEGHQEATAPDILDYTLPQFNATMHLHIGGKAIEVDLEDVMSSELKARVTQKIAGMTSLEANVRNLGGRLYQTYLHELYRQRENHTLPQLSYSVRELLETGCVITTVERHYIFLFPFEYNPQYVIDDGVRYKLSDEDIEELKRNVFAKFTVTQGYRFTRADVVEGDGRGFSHYHGDRTYDCWGNVILPERWDGRIPSLVRLVHTIKLSLATINKNSLLQSEPDSMPSIDSLMDRGTKLGREGVPDTPPPRRRGRRRTEEETPRTGWGTGRRWTGRGEAGDLPPDPDDAEFMRRFSTVTPNMDSVCALCGHIYGQHNGWHCPGGEEPPPLRGREAETMRRFGGLNPPMDAACLLCGENYGHHYGVDTITCPRDWRMREQAPRPFTEEEEYFRRWGVHTDVEASELTGDRAVCALCGGTYMRSHSGWLCTEER